MGSSPGNSRQHENPILFELLKRVDGIGEHADVLALLTTNRTDLLEHHVIPDAIVSLLPSTTEIVAAMGLQDRLVGRSHECDFPASVTTLPVISRPRRDPVGTSADIHRNVVEMLEQVLSIYEIDPKALRAADPQLIITQDLCRVCAVAQEEVVAAARTHLGDNVAVLTSSPMTLDEVYGDIRRIGTATDSSPRAEALVERMQTELRALSASIADRDRPTLALLEWADPLMAGGNWAPELIAAAGAEPVLGNAGGHSPMLDPQALLIEDPDVILIAPCGYDLNRALEDHSVVSKMPGWAELTAVRNGRVAYADGSAYFNRPGPRLVESAEIITAVAHGAGPAMALEGVAWQRPPQH